jgi:hypothetical protein
VEIFGWNFLRDLYSDSEFFSLSSAALVTAARAVQPVFSCPLARQGVYSFRAGTGPLSTIVKRGKAR